MSVYLGCTPLELLAGDEGAAPEAKPVRKGRTLVIVFLRGGADGLNLVIPFKDANYARLRKSITVGAPSDAAPAGRALDLDGTFGLHPRLRALHPLFQSGDAVALHAVGHDRNTRSHFEEQDVWETGVTGNTLNSDGWVNRHLLTSTGHGPLRAVAIGDALPRIMHGKCCAYAVQGIDDLTLPDGRTDKAAVAGALEHAYRSKAKRQAGEARDLLAQTGQATLEGIEQLQKLIGQAYKPEAAYPNTDLARQLMQAARLIASSRRRSGSRCSRWTTAAGTRTSTRAAPTGRSPTLRRGSPRRSRRSTRTSAPARPTS
jgi:uncharacterized protein (DUF1501 family)